MKLTGETEGLALVLDTAPLKARRWSRIESSPREMRGRWAPRRLGFVPLGYSG
jgi:hypothetical protein